MTCMQPFQVLNLRSIVKYFKPRNLTSMKVRCQHNVVEGSADLVFLKYFSEMKSLDHKW